MAIGIKVFMDSNPKPLLSLKELQSVKFYIRVKPGESKHVCLNYIPILWKTFSSHLEAKDAVVKQAESIWESLDIFHPLKKVKSTYGLWEKK